MDKLSIRKLNYLKKCLEIQTITKKYYRPYFTTYAGVWRKYIKNQYFINYQHYINNVLAEGNLNSRIEALEKGIEERDGKKLKFFEDDEW
ncbi:MAG: hypothetical protein LBR17_01235 [Bacteroidales bacterium]|jgi:hypothetical protein|nr:hypothetical protein [Bacteroidales bacterium]